MTIEDRLKKLKKWELIGLARKLNATGYHKFKKKELFEYLTKNFPEHEIKAILNRRTTPLMRVKDFTHVYGVQTTLSLLIGIIAIILTIIFQQSSQKTDISRDELLERMDQKLDQFDPNLKKVVEELKAALNDEDEALKAYKKGDLTIAEALFKQRIKKEINNLAVNYFNLGNTYYVGFKFDEALEAYNKATELKPEYHKSWNNKGLALKNVGRYDDALEAYNKAIEAKPDDNLSWNNKGNVLNALNRPDEALEAYNKAIEIKPDYHLVWVNKGYALRKLGRNDEALEAYNKAIEIKPDYNLAWYNLACFYSSKKEKGKALECFQKAIEYGYDNLSHVKKDNNLDFIRNEKEFKELIDKFHKK